MDLDTIFLVLRVVVALGVVVAVLWFVKRRLAKGPAKGAGSRSAGSKGGTRRTTLFGRRTSGAALRGRHALGQKSSVAVVEFDGREFLLGVTEHGVTVLHAAGVEDDVDDVEDAVATEVAPPAVVPVVAPAAVAEPLVAPEPIAVAGPEPLAAPAAEPVAAPAAPEVDWAALFARELAAQLAAQQAVAEPAIASAPEPVAPEPEPVAAQLAPDPDALVFAPRYARHGAAPAEPEDDDAPYAGAVPQPVPVRHVITGQFVAEVELMPLPTSAIPIVPVPVEAAAPATVPAAAPAAAATPVPWTPPQLAPTPPAAGAMIPTTAMIPTIVMAPRPAPAPIVPAPVAHPAHEPAPVAVAPRRAADAPRSSQHSSPLAGSILSPGTWRQTVDAFRAMR